MGGTFPTGTTTVAAAEAATTWEAVFVLLVVVVVVDIHSSSDVDEDVDDDDDDDDDVDAVDAVDDDDGTSRRRFEFVRVTRFVVVIWEKKLQLWGYNNTRCLACRGGCRILIPRFVSPPKYRTKRGRMTRNMCFYYSTVLLASSSRRF